MLERSLRVLPLTLLFACHDPAPTEAPDVPDSGPACNFVVVIDAGSSGTRAHTYTLSGTEAGLPRVVGAAKPFKNDSPLAAFIDDPPGGAASIRALLEADDSVLETVPDACRAQTSVHVMATAGMRVAEREHAKGKEASAELYAAVESAIRELGLGSASAETITGEAEGIYGWLDLNLELGGLDSGGSTVGALELGGASTQITFESPADDRTTTLKVGTRTFEVYAHSYLGYGAQEAWDTEGVATCVPRGLSTSIGRKGEVEGDGNYGTCAEALTTALTPQTCAVANCGLAQPGDESKPGVPQPPLPAEMEFYAFSGYAYVAQTLVGEAKISPRAVAEAAGGPKGDGGYCGMSWVEIQAEYSEIKPKYLERYCFQAAWSTSILQGYGFPPETLLMWSNEIEDAEITWTRGAALCLATQCMPAEGSG